MQVVAEERAIPFYGFGVGAIKKHATGRGNSGKELMLAAAEERWPGAGIVEHDRADALWILSLGLETFTAESLRGGVSVPDTYLRSPRIYSRRGYTIDKSRLRKNSGGHKFGANLVATVALPGRATKKILVFAASAQVEGQNCEN